MIEVFPNTIVVIILQQVNVPYHCIQCTKCTKSLYTMHIVYNALLTFVKYYLSITSQKELYCYIEVFQISLENGNHIYL